MQHPHSFSESTSINMASKEEIEADIATYEEQLASIEELLVEAPNDEDILALRETCAATLRDLYDLLTSLSSSSSNVETQAAGSVDQPAPDQALKSGIELNKISSYVATNPPNIPLPTGDNLAEIAFSKGLYVGLPSEAIWHEDQLWYPAMIQRISEAGVQVKYKTYNDIVWVHPEHVRPSNLIKSVLQHLASKKAQKGDIASEMDSGPHSKKRKTPDTSSPMDPFDQPFVVPEHLKILETDSDKVKESKRRQQKQLKQERRQEKNDIMQNQSKLSWQEFNKKMKRTGMGSRKESMFRTSEGVKGKVGVVGSGKGMTQPVASKESFRISTPSSSHSPSPLLYK